MNAARRYVPGLAFHALTPLYDRVLRLIFDEVALKSRLLDQTVLAAGQQVLDLGCGTGTLLLLIHEREPRAAAFGLDGDAGMLACAGAKLHAAGASPHVVVALAQEMPLAARSFDRILSTLFFHHLPTATKPAVLREVLRVLRPGGELHVMDFGRPSGWGRWTIFTVLRAFDGLDNTRDNAKGLLPRRMEEAGFEDVREVARIDTPVGTVAYYRGRRGRRHDIETRLGSRVTPLRHPGGPASARRSGNAAPCLFAPHARRIAVWTGSCSNPRAGSTRREQMTRVLVISPDRDLERFLRRELASAEFEILGSDPGPVVIDAARRARPEIAVIHWADVRRQTAALEQAILRTMRPDARIILVSSVPSTDDAELIEAGVFYYMPASPPVRLPEVVRAAARSIREESDRQLRQGEMR